MFTNINKTSELRTNEKILDDSMMYEFLSDKEKDVRGRCMFNNKVLCNIETIGNLMIILKLERFLKIYK